MDPLLCEKLHAMKRYKSRRDRGFVGAFLLKLLRLAAALVSLGLFLSCPLWIPHVTSCTREAVLFLAAAASQSRDKLLGPACLFVLCNVILVLLVGESKTGSEKEKALDIYDEYAKRFQGRMRAKTTTAPMGKVMKVVEEEGEEVTDDYGRVGVVDESVEEEEADVTDNEEEEGLPDDELDRKFEDFIANTQRRWVEERRMQAEMGCYRGWTD